MSFGRTSRNAGKGRRILGALAFVAAALMLVTDLVVGAQLSVNDPVGLAIITGILGLGAVILGRWGLFAMLPSLSRR